MTVPVSMIMPAYNSASFIERTLRSVAAQTLKGFELIVVDDGSTDETADVAEGFLSQRGRNVSYNIIRSKENRGVSHARNVGIRVCQGAYLHFMDSDDRIEPEFLETLYDSALRHQADIALCRLQWVRVDGDGMRAIPRSEPCANPPNPILGGEEALVLYFSGKLALWPGNMLLSRRLLWNNDIYFTEGTHYGEDSEVQIKAAIHAQRIIYIPRVLFYYVQREDSQMGVAGRNVEYFLDLEWIRRIRPYLHDRSASETVMNRLEHYYIPRHINWRSKRLPHGASFAKEATQYLSALARAYPYRMDTLGLRDAYYWTDNRVLAYAPSLYRIWNPAVKTLLRLRRRLIGIPGWMP